jgi:hypothetical protein
MKTAEEKAKECIDNLIDSLSLEVNYEESNYDAGQVYALSNYGKEIYKVGFLEGQSNLKIKQLEWVEDVLFADIIVSDGFSLLFYRINIIDNTLYIGDTAQSFNAIEEAKAAAQADFEVRIKECLITE